MNNIYGDLNPEITPFYHEVGHWMIATGLGYEGYITGNPESNNNFGYILTTPPDNSKQDLKNRLLVAFGGLGAEKLLDIPLNAGHIGDITMACEHLKKLYSLENKIFNFRNHMDFPDKEYEYYLTQSKIVLNQLGGKEAILNHGKSVYEQLQRFK